jgi:hypothetical protein
MEIDNLELGSVTLVRATPAVIKSIILGTIDHLPNGDVEIKPIFMQISQ